MAAGKGLEALLQALDELCNELGWTDDEADIPRTRSPLSSSGIRSLSDPQDEMLVRKVMRRLASLATVLGAAQAEGVRRRALCAALDGAELVMRGELSSGNARQLPSLIPSFVFLVTVPIIEQDAALDLSQRTSDLITRAWTGTADSGTDRRA